MASMTQQSPVGQFRDAAVASSLIAETADAYRSCRRFGARTWPRSASQNIIQVYATNWRDCCPRRIIDRIAGRETRLAGAKRARPCLTMKGVLILARETFSRAVIGDQGPGNGERSGEAHPPVPGHARKVGVVLVHGSRASPAQPGRLASVSPTATG